MIYYKILILLFTQLLFIQSLLNNQFSNNLLLNNKFSNNKLLNNKFSNNKLLYCNLNNKLDNNFNDIKIIIKNKTTIFMKLIIYNNLLTTLLLNLSGGFIMNPSLINLLYNKNFILSSIITSLIMSTSMIINDFYDINIDKVNNVNRPLVTGEITKTEAIISIIILSCLIEYLNLFLSTNLQIVVQISLFLIHIYTPIIKKIFFVKNIFCACLVSLSIFFSGLSTSSSLLVYNKNYELFLIEISFIFLGSLYNEILLDMTDIEGDKKNNIYTIPVIFGKQSSLIFECFIVLYNMISSFLMLALIVDIKYVLIFQLVFIPFIYNLYIIYKNNLDDSYIKQSKKYINISLFASIIYICLLQFTII
jgi:geranylgeranylglycerol-phosphate geranylgeranyltransferase